MIGSGSATAGTESAPRTSAEMQIRRMLNSVLFTPRSVFSARAQYRLKPRLFGKFCSTPRGSLRLCTLFIKTGFILRQRAHPMVNRTWSAAAKMSRAGMNAVLSPLMLLVGWEMGGEE